MRGDLQLLPMWYVAFLLSTTVHEASHALVGKKMGDHTAEDQITINPLPHIQREPVGTVVVPLLSYVLGGWMLGWASAPFDPYWRVRYPHRGAWVALAGPMSNLILAVIAGICIHVGLASGVFSFPYMLSFSHLVSAANPGVWEGAALFVSILFSLNILLFAFNLIPLPPLDGSTAICLLMDESTALRFMEATRNPQFNFIGLLIAWKLFDVVFPPVFGVAIRLLY
jgi:Zn-dependent protease